jgi:hypothetical protein
MHLFSLIKYEKKESRNEEEEGKIEKFSLS